MWWPAHRKAALLQALYRSSSEEQVRPTYTTLTRNDYVVARAQPSVALPLHPGAPHPFLWFGYTKVDRGVTDGRVVLDDLSTDERQNLTDTLDEYRSRKRSQRGDPSETTSSPSSSDTGQEPAPEREDDDDFLFTIRRSGGAFNRRTLPNSGKRKKTDLQFMPFYVFGLRQDVRVLKMDDLRTQTWLRSFGDDELERCLDSSFPVREGKVYRNSTLDNDVKLMLLLMQREIITADTCLGWIHDKMPKSSADSEHLFHRETVLVMTNHDAILRKPPSRLSS